MRLSQCSRGQVEVLRGLCDASRVCLQPDTVDRVRVHLEPCAGMLLQGRGDGRMLRRRKWHSKQKARREAERQRNEAARAAKVPQLLCAWSMIAQKMCCLGMPLLCPQGTLPSIWRRHYEPGAPSHEKGSPPHAVSSPCGRRSLHRSILAAHGVQAAERRKPASFDAAAAVKVCSFDWRRSHDHWCIGRVIAACTRPAAKPECVCLLQFAVQLWNMPLCRPSWRRVAAELRMRPAQSTQARRHRRSCSRFYFVSISVWLTNSDAGAVTMKVQQC